MRVASTLVPVDTECIGDKCSETVLDKGITGADMATTQAFVFTCQPGYQNLLCRKLASLA
jgi:hypothetical protein